VQEDDGDLAGGVSLVLIVAISPVIGSQKRPEPLTFRGRGRDGDHFLLNLFNLYIYPWMHAQVEIPGGVSIAPIVRRYNEESGVFLKIAYGVRLRFS
jgi:hypothetical protein